MIVAGDQVPVIPFGDARANTGAVALIQIGGTAAKFGVRVVAWALGLRI